jgi:ribosomal protein S18 acetylase RimI-like enzyme
MIIMSDSNKDIQIRWYMPKDFEMVKKLIKGLANLYNDEFNEYFFSNSMQVRALDASSGTFVAESKGDVCGCAFANTERDPRGVLWGLISNVNVDDTHQGKGVGAKLVDEATNFLSALNIPGIWANVNPNNEKMIRLFEKREFKQWLKVMEKRVDPYNVFEKGETKIGDIAFRTIVEKDLTDVKALIMKLSSLFNVGFEPYWFDIYIQKFFQDPASRVFVAEKGGKIIGVAFAEVRRDPTGSSYGFISNIMVDDSAQGQGVGPQLLHQAGNFLSNLNIKKLWANINADNPKMEKIFEKHGFSHKFTVMVKELNFGAAC